MRYIFLQDGNERRMRIERNLVVLARKATTATALLQSEVGRPARHCTNAPQRIPHGYRYGYRC